MKKQLLTFIALTTIGVGATAQDYCRITMDSIIDGDGATAFATYTYDMDSKLVLVEQTDSSSMSVDNYDTIYYDAQGRIDLVETYSTSPVTLRESTNLIYDANSRISRIEESGDNGSGPWTKAFDLTYYSWGDLSSMKVDATSVTGDPEGMMMNWENIIWTNGNMTSVDLVGDFGSGADQIELIATYDDKKNIARLEPVTEAPDIILRFSNNNMRLITLANDEVGFGASAGDTALYRTFTYNSYDEVLTMADFPYLFGDDYEQVQYSYDCNTTLSIEEENKNTIQLYPNPSSSVITVENDNVIESVTVIDLQGKNVIQMPGSSTEMRVDITQLPAGIYLIEVESKGGIIREKIIKE